MHRRWLGFGLITLASAISKTRPCLERLPKRRPLFVAAAIVLCFAAAPSFAEDFELIEVVKGWGIVHDKTDDQSCYAVADYAGGITFSFGMNDHAEWSVQIANPDWLSIHEGQEYEIDWLFDGRRTWTVKAGGIENGLRATDSRDDLIQDLARSSSLKLSYRNKELARLNLSGTRAAMNAILDCYKNRIEKTDPFAPDDPFAVGDPFASDDSDEVDGKLADVSWNPTEQRTFEKKVGVVVCADRSTSCNQTYRFVGSYDDVSRRVELSISVLADSMFLTHDLTLEDYGFSSIEFRVGDIDTENDTREVEIAYYTGGAHCCSRVLVLTAKRTELQLVDLGAYDGEPWNASDHKLGVYVLPDQRFLYAFAPYAGSGPLPLQMLKISGGEIVDVTREDRFRSEHAKILRFAEEGCAEGQNSWCASYVASAALLSRQEDAWAFMLEHYDRGDDDPDGNDDPWLPMFCDVEVRWDEECPKDKLVTFDSFPTALSEALVRWDYWEEEDRLRFVSAAQPRGPRIPIEYHGTWAPVGDCSLEREGGELLFPFLLTQPTGLLGHEMMCDLTSIASGAGNRKDIALHCFEESTESEVVGSISPKTLVLGGQVFERCAFLCGSPVLSSCRKAD